MIFVTVGAQMPLDRMIRTVDEWAGLRQRNDVFAQIGPTDYAPRYIEHSRFITPEQFHEYVEMADTIVAHAGMGTIITAVERRKPILVMPRRSDLDETRNDHQIATARQFGSIRLVEVAMDERELLAKLDTMDQWRATLTGGPDRNSPHCAMCPFAEDPGMCAARAVNHACPHLLSGLHAFVAEEQPVLERCAAAPGVLT